MKTDCIEAFDLDLTLKDASTDPIIRPTRRMIAAACIGMGPEDAYYSVRELREAIEWIHEGEPSGKRKLTQILGNQCDDFQRCIYYALAGKGIVLILDVNRRGILTPDRRPTLTPLDGCAGQA